MAWLFLFLAGLTEIIWVVSLKIAIIRSHPIFYLIVFGSVCLNIWLMSVVIRTIPISTAYGIWVGIGTLGTSLVGILFFKEPWTATRIFLLVLLVLVVAGLRFTSSDNQVIP